MFVAIESSFVFVKVWSASKSAVFTSISELFTSNLPSESTNRLRPTWLTLSYPKQTVLNWFDPSPILAVLLIWPMDSSNLVSIVCNLVFVIVWSPSTPSLCNSKLPKESFTSCRISLWVVNLPFLYIKLDGIIYKITIYFYFLILLFIF